MCVFVKVKPWRNISQKTKIYRIIIKKETMRGASIE